MDGDTEFADPAAEGEVPEGNTTLVFVNASGTVFRTLQEVRAADRLGILLRWGLWVPPKSSLAPNILWLLLPAADQL